MSKLLLIWLGLFIGNLLLYFTTRNTNYKRSWWEAYSSTVDQGIALLCVWILS